MRGSTPITHLLALIAIFIVQVNAQFNIFEQMFGGGGHQQQQQQQQRRQNVGSDSSWFQQNWDNGKTFFRAMIFS
jgi:hypothetical protein